MSRKLWIASDHAGVALKSFLQKQLPQVSWIDLGPATADSVDYPDYAQQLCKAVLLDAKQNPSHATEPNGILICGSGVGMSISANRFKDIRAVLAESSQVAVLSRQHNASNVLCLGSRILSESQALEITSKWLATVFEGGRHQKRIDKIDAIERPS